jgi:hypothetical protein
MKLSDAVMLKLQKDLDILSLIICVIALLALRFSSKSHSVDHYKYKKILVYGAIIIIVLHFIDILINAVFY